MAESPAPRGPAAEPRRSPRSIAPTRWRPGNRRRCSRGPRCWPRWAADRRPSRAYQRVLASRPDSGAALRGLGDAALARGDVAAAEAYLTRDPAARSRRTRARCSSWASRDARRPGGGGAGPLRAGRGARPGAARRRCSPWPGPWPRADGRRRRCPTSSARSAAGARTTVALNGLGFARLESGDARGALESPARFAGRWTRASPASRRRWPTSAASWPGAQLSKRGRKRRTGAAGRRRRAPLPRPHRGARAAGRPGRRRPSLVGVGAAALARRPRPAARPPSAAAPAAPATTCCWSRSTRRAPTAWAATATRARGRGTSTGLAAEGVRFDNALTPGAHHAARPRLDLHRPLPLRARRAQQRQLLPGRARSPPWPRVLKAARLSHGRLRQLLHPRPPLRPGARLRQLRRPHGGRAAPGHRAGGRAPRRPHGAGARTRGSRRGRVRRAPSSPGSTSTIRTSPTGRRRPSATLFADAPYDGEIAFDDAIVAAVLDRLRASGPARPHARGGDRRPRREPGRARRRDALDVRLRAALRVPMILWRPGRVPAGRVVTQPVRATDLAPTLLDLLGAPP